MSSSSASRQNLDIANLYGIARHVIVVSLAVCILSARVCVCACAYFDCEAISATIYANCAPIAEIALAIQNSHVSYVSPYCDSFSQCHSRALSCLLCVYVCVAFIDIELIEIVLLLCCN